jgi:YVTN family beta-propeller protein
VGVALGILLVGAVATSGLAGSLAFYRAGETAIALFNNLTGQEVDELRLRFTEPVAPVNAVGIGASMSLASSDAGDVVYTGNVVPNGTWEVDWVWGTARLEYAAWLSEGEVIEEIPVHDPNAVFGVLGRWAGQRYHFNALPSADPDGEALARVLWEWSDGVAAEGALVFRAFSPGEYTVLLTVWDVEGRVATRAGRFTVEGCRLDVDVLGSGSVGVIPMRPYYEYGDIVRLNPTPSAHWDFAGWSGDLGGAAMPGVVRILGHTHVTAHFEPHPYLLDVSIDGNGSVSSTPDQAFYFYGDAIVLDAVADEHWDFIEWSGDLTGTDDPALLTILGDTYVAAHFDWHDYLLNVSTIGNGSVTQLPSQSGYHYGTVVVLDPEAAEHWDFIEWTGDLSGTDNPGTITITGDTSVTATFDWSGSSMAYVTNFGSGTVTVINTVTRLAEATIPVGAGPSGITFLGDKIYVANRDSGTVSVIDGPTNTVVATIPVGTWPIYIEPAGGNAYVTNEHSASVSVFDPVTDTPVDTIPVGDHPFPILVIGTEVYVANYGGGSISVIDSTTDTVVATIPVGGQPVNMATLNGKVYVANRSGSVSVIDTTSMAVTAMLGIGGSPVAVAVAEDKVYVAQATANQVTVIDSSTDTVLSQISVGSNPWPVATSAGMVCVANMGSDSVTLIDPATDTVVSVIPVGDWPHRLRASSDELFIASWTAATVHIVDVPSRAVVGSVSVGAQPYDIGFGE